MKFEILTSEGFKAFNGFKRSIRGDIICLYFISGNKLRCTPEHKIKINTTEFKEAKDFINGDVTSTGEIVLSAERISKKEYVYDALDVDGGNVYLTGSVESHNCKFLGSADTLIDPDKLSILTFEEPIRSTDHLKIFRNPQPEHSYMIVADTSHGIGGDYSAFVVFDVSRFPYEVVATYRDNMVTPLVYPNFIHEAAQKYNNAAVLVESNDIGEQVANILNYDLEYEELLMTATSGRAGQVLGGFGGATSRFGVKTTKPVKKVGCSALKDLVEANQLILNDFSIVQELITFVADGQSYSAEDGHHDDLVMCLVLFGWCTTQSYMKDLVNSDLRIKVLEERELQIEEGLAPFGFIDDGRQEAYHPATIIMPEDGVFENF